VQEHKRLTSPTRTVMTMFDKEELVLFEYVLNVIIGNSNLVLESLDQYQDLIALLEKVRKM